MIDGVMSGDGEMDIRSVRPFSRLSVQEIASTEKVETDIQESGV